MKRRATIALCVLTLVGCENMGLEYAGTGEEGRNRAPTELVSAVHQPAPAASQPVIADGRRWVPGGTPITLDSDELRSVGSSAGQTVYARQWDDAPFDMLYVPSQPAETAGRSPGGESQQETDDTAADAPAQGTAGSPGTAGARGTSGATSASGETRWQPLVPVIGEDGGHPGQSGQAQDAQDQGEPLQEEDAEEQDAQEQQTGR